jgi:hypothetical protein
MIRHQKLLIVGLFACLAAAQRAGSQSLQGGQLTTQTNSGKTAKAGNIGRSLNTGSLPNRSPVLYFQPGIGWQRVPMGKLSGADTPDSSISGKKEANKSATGASSQSVHSQPNSAKQGLAPEVRMGDITTGHRDQTVTSAHLPGMSAGALPSLQATSLFNPAGGAASGRLTMTLGSMPSGSTHRSSGSEPGVSSNPVGDLKSHAYISSIVLRRMIRTAPDLETRIKLQEIQGKLSSKSHASSVSSKGNQARKGRSKGAHVGTADSSSMSDGHGRAADVARALSSRRYP